MVYAMESGKKMDGQPKPPFNKYEDWGTVFATNEQLARLAAISLDALSGVQFRTDDSDMTAIVGCFVPIDNTNQLRHFVIYTDGRFEDQT